MSDGVFYIPARDVIVVLSYVQVYEDIDGKTFVICTWSDEKGQFKKTLIRNFDMFERIGQI